MRCDGELRDMKVRDQRREGNHKLRWSNGRPTQKEWILLQEKVLGKWLEVKQLQLWHLIKWLAKFVTLKFSITCKPPKGSSACREKRSSRVCPPEE